MLKIISYKISIMIFIIIFHYTLECKAQGDVINTRLNMYLSIGENSSVSNLTEIIQVLNDDGIKKQRPVDTVFYGYAYVFMADIYNKNKLYPKAAESIKRAFFYIDESVESNKNNWALIYLRLRMDAFVPSYLGRCIIAIDDSNKLLSYDNVYPDLIPMVEYMYARALNNCMEHNKANALLAKLLHKSGSSKEIAKYGFNRVPPWLYMEKELVIRPLILEEY